MRISKLGVFVVVAALVAALAIWVVGYIGLPNADTHSNLAENPAVESSAANTTGGSSTGGGGAASGGAAATNSIVTVDKAPKTVDLNLVSSDMNTNSGLNFNGYANGGLVVTVPAGWTVKVTYTNKESMNHSVGITTWAAKNSTGTFPAAFPNSIGPKFQNGIGSSDPALTYSFKTTNKAGKYAIVCGIPGHAVGGMYDELDVSTTEKMPMAATSSAS
jgi:Sulfocyanin (SoxE) domain